MSDRAIRAIVGRAQQAEDAICKAERGVADCLHDFGVLGTRGCVISAQLVSDGGGSTYSPSWLYVVTLVQEEPV